MHAATYIAFRDELVKIASAGHAGVDIAGLSMLAAPTISRHFGGEKNEWSEKNKRRSELAGLGTLTAGVAHEHRGDFANAAKKGWGAVKGLAKRADVDLWNPSTGAVHSGVGGTRASNLGVSVGSAAKSAKKPAFTMAHLRDAYSKAGLKPGLGSAVRSAASHIR